MKPTDLTKRHVISAYVEPARQRGVNTVRVKVGSVQKELGWTNRTPSVFSTLSSKDFQREVGVELVEKTGGPASGGRAQRCSLCTKFWTGQPPSPSKPSPSPMAPVWNRSMVCAQKHSKRLGAARHSCAANANGGLTRGKDMRSSSENIESARPENEPGLLGLNAFYLPA